MKTTISRTGHLTLPAEIRQQDQIEPGHNAPAPAPISPMPSSATIIQAPSGVWFR